MIQTKPLRFTLPYPPSANRYWRSVGNRVLVSREAEVYKRKVRLICHVGVGPIIDDVRVTLNVYRPRRVGDLDNRIKVCLDSLRGIAFVDDSQVVGLVAYRHDDKLNPRVDVLVERAA